MGGIDIGEGHNNISNAPGDRISAVQQVAVEREHVAAVGPAWCRLGQSRQTGRQIDRQTGRQADRTDRQSHRIARPRSQKKVPPWP